MGRTLVFLLLMLGSLSISLVESAVTLSCPRGVVTRNGVTRNWSLRYGRCYLTVPESHVTWDEAVSVCHQYGGVLVEPGMFKLTEEVGAIAVGTEPTLTQLWIGFNRRGVTGDLTQGRWSDGRSTSAEVGFWGSGQPDVSSGDCAYMSRGSGNVWSWGLTHCDTDMPFVCQATPCTDGTFRCHNGQCVGLSNVCNGENNCGDDSDEMDCPNQCSYHIMKGDGFQSHPTDGSNYLPSQTCQWIIEGAIGSRLQIQFVSMATEADVDFVEVWVGGRSITTSVMVRRLSGSDSEGLILSSNNVAIVRFVSDSSYQDSGFQFSWQSKFQCSMEDKEGYSVDDDEAPSSVQQIGLALCGQRCSSDAQCVAYVYDRFNGQCSHYSAMPKPKRAECCSLYVKTCPGYGNMPLLDLPPGEGGELIAEPLPQRFSSPLYPLYYMGSTVSHWTITAPGRHIISLHVLDLDLAPGDSVLVFDGVSSRDNQLASMTGTDVIAPALMLSGDRRIILSTGSSMFVQFSSSMQSTQRGFLFAYRAGCQFDLSADTGRIISPGYQTDLYPNILQCDWAIQVKAGRTLTLTFDPSFALETNKDFLLVEADGSPVHTGSGFTGITAPRGLVALNGRVALTMVTGATGRAVGFSATFNAGCEPVNDPTLATPYTANFGQSVVVQCASEYVFTGIHSTSSSVGVRCLEGGVWDSDPFPTCTRVFCGPPDDINNGYIVSSTGPYSGDTVTYACETGFRLSSSSADVRCRNTGRWDTPPFCYSDQACTVVQDPFQGRYLITAGNGFDHGSVVNFTCTNSLYELKGSANLVCENGKWSGAFPTCERIPCVVPYVANGTVSPSVNVVDGQTLRVDCNPGFVLNGSAIFRCGETKPSGCINDNECQGNPGCNQGCVDTVGSYYCTCNPGYALLSDRTTCTDIDECSLNNGGCDGFCVNLPGSYRCNCVGSEQLYTSNGQFGIFLPASETGLEPWNVYHINHTCINTPTVECPAPPQTITRGHMLGETDRFTVGQAVTYLCDMGYTAQGQTTITCQSNGNWSSTIPTCVVATCPVPNIALGQVSPQTPVNYLDYVTVTCDLAGVNQQQLRSRCIWDENSLSYRVDTNLLRCDITGIDCGEPTRLPGSLPYSVSQTGYQAQFSLRCRAPLFNRVGKSGIRNNEVVVCGADGQWDFGDLRCEGPTCPDPGTFAGTEQVATTYEEFSYVSYSCVERGFELTSDKPLYCEYDPSTGGLAWNGTAPNCTDKERPIFANCPSSDREVAYLTSALFSEPVASDNVMVSSLTVTPNDFRVSNVIQTDMQVSYIARDHAGNVGTCVVSIRVRDESPPQIRCRSSFEEQLFSENQRAVYDPLNFVLSQADNSGLVDLAYSVNPLIIDRYNVGDIFTVKIDASDKAGNTDICLVQVKVTAPPCLPWSLHVDNGDVTCYQQSNTGYRCDATCNNGHKFFEDPDITTISLSCSSGGSWDRVAPVCTSAYYTNYRVAFTMDYRTRSLPSLDCQATYVSQLEGQMTALGASLTALCASDVVVSAAANINPVSVLDYNDGVYATIRLDLDSSLNDQSAITACKTLVISAFSAVRNEISAIRTLFSQNNCDSSEVVRYVSTVQDSINCQNNQESRVEPSTGRYQCLACKAGYTSTGGSKCSACSVGSYFDASSGSCQFCPSGTRSQQLAARSIDDCYLHCPYGYVSNTGDAPCRPCLEHTYSLNRTYCATCPAGEFTRGDAQGYPASCRAACQPGFYSYDGLAPCTPCPKGFYQPQAGTSTCVECNSDQTTVATGSTKAVDCQSALPLVCSPNPCYNGTCIASNHDYRCLCPTGYTGRNCQTRIRPCDSNPCFNDAFCNNKDNDYECVCTKPQTTGRNCEIDKENECLVNPCQNFGACQDRVANHICLCPSFSNYTYSFGLPGSDCIKLRDPCQEDPCQNGASCVNYGSIRRKCMCPDGYEGDSCSIDKNYCGSNPCQNGGQCAEAAGSRVSCTCLPGYTGSLCEVRLDKCDVTVCGPLSTCVDVYTTDQVQCYCNQGYKNVGGTCQAIVVDSCLSSPCENNSTCVRSGSSYQCLCLPGFEGGNCQHNIDDCASNPCLNGGTCRDLLGDFQCICPPDTNGKICQDAIDQCSFATNPCNPYGTDRCIDLYQGYICYCLPGYYGVHCDEGQTNCKSFPCRHGANCTDSGNSYFCTCADGFEGPNCERLRDFCASNPCLAGGTCVNTDTGTVCKCPPGYRGDTCQIRYSLCSVANPCVVQNSVCRTDANNEPSCTCPSGYTGLYCEVSDNQCQSSTCQNGGTCSDVGGVVLCSCPAGFSGAFCQTNNDDCLSSPCPSTAVCQDGVNSFVCTCAQDKIGDGCYKALSSNFDLVVLPNANYPFSTPYLWPLSSSALTVATWVRFTQRTTPGTILSLYGLSSASSVSNPQHLIRIERSSATLDFDGTKTLTISPAIDDGYWHHVALSWDGATGQATLYIDDVISASTTSYGRGIRLAPYGWTVVGGIYDSGTNTVDRSQGMVGRLSRLHVSTQSVTSAEVSRMYADTSFVPTGSLLGLTKDLLNGTSAAVDYDSQLTRGVCLSSKNCRDIDTVLSRPTVTQCPDNQMVTSSRRSQPSWTTASFLTNDPVDTNYVSGGTEMGWGYYGLAYAQSDSDGDAAVCTFMLHNRRYTCSEPVPPRYGSQSCVPTASGLRCSARCDGDFSSSRPGPLFYSCGTSGMYDADDRQLAFTYPSCSSCQRPLLDITMELNYTATTSLPCPSILATLTSRVIASLDALNNNWQQGICNAASCDNVQVDVDCPQGQGQQSYMVTVNLPAVEELLRNFDNSAVSSATEVLEVAVADSGSFTYSEGSPDLSSLLTSTQKACPVGRVLQGNCCVGCGLGRYYNLDNGQCASCPQNTYQDKLLAQGTPLATPCTACPSGLVTPTNAAQSLSDCTESCTFGSFFNMTSGQCQICPVGFYAENPGQYWCDACPFQQSTAREGATAAVSCSVNPITTPSAPNTSFSPPNTGASTASEELSWPEIVLAVLAVILFIILIILFLFFCCRQQLVKMCPCLVTKVKPAEKTGWHYVDRFGETKMRFASYNLSEMRARKSDRDLLDDSVEEGSVHTNISLQVPVFEERLNGMVKKKSVHVSEHATETAPKPKKDKRRKKKKRRNRPTAVLDSDPQTTPDLGTSSAPVSTHAPNDVVVRRPPSAFNRPRPTLDDVPYDNFVSPRAYDNIDSVSNAPSLRGNSARIMIDSDDDER